MNFSLVVSAPAGTANADSALDFARALLQQGHTLLRVFFVGDAVRLACASMDHPSAHEWQILQCNSGIELSACITDFRQRHPNSADEIRSGFMLSGMGQLADSCHRGDRLLTFR